MADNAPDDDLVMKLVDQALARPSDQREAYLLGACSGNPDLYSQVLGYVQWEDRMKGFLLDPLYTPAAHEHPLEAGDLLDGRFRIVREVAQGGMGIVYEAVDEKLGRRIALKCAKAGFRKRLPPEVRHATEISHHNVCKIHEIHSTTSRHGEIDFITMEFLDGETLSERLRRGRIPEKEARLIAAQLCAGLAEAHGNQVIHGDLKSGNVILTTSPNGEVRAVITDFGLAHGSDNPQRTVQTGELGGTPDYMAPELWKGQKASIASDIFALGVILYELASGRLPLASADAESPSSWEQKLSRKPPPANPGWDRTLWRCLDPDPARRFRSADEIARALAPSPIRRAVLTTIAVASLLVIAAGIVTYYRVTAPKASKLHEMEVLPVTALPGGEYEPAIAPAGDRIAFVWDRGLRERSFDIFVRGLNGGEPQAITNTPASEGSPTWSPDGRRLAFLRYDAGADSGVFIQPLEGGPEIKLTSTVPLRNIFARHLDWSPDGKYLALADRLDARFQIFLVSTETGERRRLTSPPADSLGDTGPVFSADSRTLLFRRSLSAGVDDLYSIGVTGGPESVILQNRKAITGHAWDGSRVLFASERNGQLGLWRLTPESGAAEPLPFGEGAHFLAVSRAGDQIAYSKVSTDSDIYEARLDGGKSVAWRPLISSTMLESSPDYSPDGKRVAFRADRSGSSEIWISAADGNGVTQLTHMNGPMTGSPRWSPDSSQVAFDSRPKGNGDIFVTSLSGEAPRQVTTSSADDVLPEWSGDGKSVYFASNRKDGWQIWRAGVAGERSAPAEQVTREGGFGARLSRDGRWVYYAKAPDTPGLWRVPAAGGVEELVLKELPVGFYALFVPFRQGVLVVLPGEGGNYRLTQIEPGSPERRPILNIDWRIRIYDGGLAVSADGTKVLCSRIMRDDSDIYRVRGFH